MLDPTNRPRPLTFLGRALILALALTTLGLLAACQPEVEEAAVEEDLREEEALEEAEEYTEEVRTALGNFELQLGDGEQLLTSGIASCVVEPATGAGAVEETGAGQAGAAGEGREGEGAEVAGAQAGATGTAGPSGALRVSMNPEPIGEYRYFLEIRDYSGTGQYTGTFGLDGAERSSGTVQVGVLRVAEADATGAGTTAGGEQQSPPQGATQMEEGATEEAPAPQGATGLEEAEPPQGATRVEESPTDEAPAPAPAPSGATRMEEAAPQLTLNFAGSYSGAAGSGAVEGRVRCPLPDSMSDSIGLEPAEEEIE